MTYRFAFVLFLAFCLPLPSEASELCSEIVASLSNSISKGKFPEPTIHVTSGYESTTPEVFSIRHSNGSAKLIHWDWGAAGRVACSIIFYQTSPTKIDFVEIPGIWVSVEDLNGDNIDEVKFHEITTWGDSCSRDMYGMAYDLRIVNLDSRRRSLINVTKEFPVEVYDYLQWQAEKFNRFPEDSGSLLNKKMSISECRTKWKDLIAQYYETAWRIFLIGGSIISVLTFFLGFSRKKSLKRAAKIVGTITTISLLGIAFYSLRGNGWIVMGFSDFWDAFQIVTGSRFNTVFLDIASAILAFIAGVTLMMS